MSFLLIFANRRILFRHNLIFYFPLTLWLSVTYDINHMLPVDLNALAPNPKLTDWSTLAWVIVKNAFVLAGVISFVFIVLGGFGVIFGAGSGDPKSMQAAKQKVTYAVIGLIIVVTSYWLVQLIGKVIGVDLFNLGV